MFTLFNLANSKKEILHTCLEATLFKMSGADSGSVRVETPVLSGNFIDELNPPGIRSIGDTWVNERARVVAEQKRDNYNSSGLCYGSGKCQ